MIYKFKEKSIKTENPMHLKCKIPDPGIRSHLVSFVPTQLVLDYYLKLEKLWRSSAEPEAVAALSILEYFGRVYVSIDKAGHQISTRFPPAMWNNYKITDEDDPRTNNCVEAWHRRFETQVGRNHPNIWKFLKDI